MGPPPRTAHWLRSAVLLDPGLGWPAGLMVAPGGLVFTYAFFERGVYRGIDHTRTRGNLRRAADPLYLGIFLGSARIALNRNGTGDPHRLPGGGKSPRLSWRSCRSGAQGRHGPPALPAGTLPARTRRDTPAAQKEYNVRQIHPRDRRGND